MFTGILALLGPVWKYIAGLVAVIVVLGGVYGLGYHNGTTTVYKAEASAAASITTKIQTQIRTQYVVDTKKVKELNVALEQARQSESNLQARLDSAPDPNRGTYLSVGDVSLLNCATTELVCTGASEPTDAAFNTPSTVTVRAFVSTEIKVREQYVEQGKQLDALITWDEDNLVKPK